MRTARALESTTQKNKHHNSIEVLQRVLVITYQMTSRARPLWIHTTNDHIMSLVVCIRDGVLRGVSPFPATQVIELLLSLASASGAAVPGCSLWCCCPWLQPLVLCRLLATTVCCYCHLLLLPLLLFLKCCPRICSF